MESKGLNRKVMRWVVMLVVGAIVLSALFYPIVTALGAETAPATPATTTPPAAGASGSTTPANPHAGVPGAPGGTPATAAPMDPLIAGKLGVEVTHLVLTTKDQVVSVFQMTQLVNDTDKASGPVTIPLPAGAKNLEVIGLNADQYSQSAAGWVNKAGLKAHETAQLTYRFEVPADGQALTLKETFSFPVAQVFILTDPATMTMPAAINTAFEDAGALEINNRTYMQLVRGGVQPGDALQVNVQLTPDTAALSQIQSAAQANPAAATAAPAKKTNIGLFVSVAALLLAALLVAITWLTRQRRQQGLAGSAILEHSAASPAVTEALVSLTRRKADLIEQIAELDAQKAQGEIDGAGHASRRDSLKQELVAVMRELKSLEG